MKQKLVVAAILIALVLAISLIVFVAASGSTRRMASYQGKTDREWLEQVETTNSAAAYDAFRTMGTNALPTVVGVMNDTTPNRIYGWIYPKVPMSFRQHWAAPVTSNTWSAAELVLFNIFNRRTAYPDLVQLLGNPGNRARPYIIGVVVNETTPDDAEYVPIFRNCLKDTNATVRLFAAEALLRIGPAAKSAVPDLVAALQDPDVKMRVNAAFTLWQLDRQTPATVNAAKASLRSEAAANDREASIVLAMMAPDDPSTLPMLVSVLKGGNQSERMRAVGIIGGRGPDARAVVPDLLELLNGEKDKSSDFHHRLGQALLNIDPAAWWKYLESVHGQAK